MADRLVPSERQLAFMDWEWGLFFHFGIRSFFKGHKDWDNRPMPAESFNPTELNCMQWCREARDAGARYAILVCKHHDGFANWPTRYSDYSVKSAPWKDGKGDVVREFPDACRACGLKVGLYYSPAQWGGETGFDSGTAYDDYFVGQLTELLTWYGKIDYLWFDGCGSEKHSFDRERIIRAIRSLQPEILIFQMWDPDTRWIGNEDGYAPLNNPNVRECLDFSMLATEQERLEAARYLPAECDCMMRDTWFDCADNEDKVKTPEELLGLYEMTVGRGSNLLINIGPDRRGLLPEKDVQALRGFGELLKARYGQANPFFGEVRREGEDRFAIQTAAFHPDREEEPDTQPQLISRVVIEEDVSGGDRVRAFRLWASLPGYRTKEICLYEGRTIGHKHICAFPLTRTAKISLEITESSGGASIKEMRAYR